MKSARPSGADGLATEADACLDPLVGGREGMRTR
jgi:hypothetical protein